MSIARPLSLHELLDTQYGPDADEVLRTMLRHGDNPDARAGPRAEAPLHVATRRRRLSAVTILLDHGAAIDAETLGGKTAYTHAIRRGFTEIAEVLAARGADRRLNDADRLAVALTQGSLDEADAIYAAHRHVIRTGNPEEDRLLADIAGRSGREPVAFLIGAGADLRAPGLDEGTPLHQAAWFGQPGNARLLIEAGAPLDVFDATHHSSPLGWAVHGSRYSGGAAERQATYVALVAMLLEAGSSLHYPDEPKSDTYYRRLLADASEQVAPLLQQTPR